jgi:glycerophosphoryl diester phosphodiesterase
MNTKPLVFGHRGASGYRPENTLEAFELAFQMGSDAIECDLVPTKDGYLIIRHENELSGTTDVASRPEFASRKRTQVFYDHWEVTGWFSEDFTLDEIRSLRAIERLPHERPGSAKFDGQFAVPTIEDLLNAPWANGKCLILEIKHGSHFKNIGFDTVAMLADVIGKNDWRSRGISLVFEAFHYDAMIALTKEIPAALGGDIRECKFVFLLEGWGMPEGGAAALPAFLDNLVGKVDGVSFDVNLLFDHVDHEGNAAQFGSPNNIVQMAHDRGFMVYSWTARAEQAKFSIDEYYQHFIDLGADGIFADQPDLFRQCVDAQF